MLVGYALSLPFFILFVVFTVAPVLGSVFVSFTDFDMMRLPGFVGIENYTRLFLEDKVFAKALGNTFVIALIVGPCGYLLSFIVAWLLNEVTPKMRSILTLCFYAPSISGNMAVIWQFFFSGDSQGYLNSILYQLGISNAPTLWLKNPDTMLPIICFVSLWASLGTSFLVFIAGFQGVDKSYYEAAAIDGVRNRWQELWYVTLPSLKPQLIFGAVMSISGAFGCGAVSTALCGFPSTDYAAHTILNHMEDYGTTKFEMGYAGAVATILFLMMLGTNKLIQKAISNVGN